MIETWKDTHLGEVFASITNGVNCDQKSNSGAHLITRIETISKGSVDLERIGRANLNEKELSKYRLLENDILFSHINSPIHVGKTALFDTNAEVYHGVNLLRIRTIKDVNPKFLRYFLLFLYTSGFWRTVAKQSVNQASVNQKDISEVPFSYPSLEKQKEIVEKLDGVFAGIDLLERNLLLGDEKANRLIQSVLSSEISFDSGVISNNPYANQETSVNLVKLSEVFRVGSSKRVLKSDWKESGVPFYRGREITRLSKTGFADNELFVSEEHYLELSTKYGVPVANDIMVTAIGTIGNTYIVKSQDKFYFKDASVIWLHKIKEVDSHYVNYWLKSELFLNQLDRGNGATVDTLTIEKLSNVKLFLPSLVDQKRIVEKLDNTFSEIDLLKAQIRIKRDYAIALRQSLLSSAFSLEEEVA